MKCVLSKKDSLKKMDRTEARALLQAENARSTCIDRSRDMAGYSPLSLIARVVPWCPHEVFKFLHVSQATLRIYIATESTVSLS
jgi:hypothetical protein